MRAWAYRFTRPLTFSLDGLAGATTIYDDCGLPSEPLGGDAYLQHQGGRLLPRTLARDSIESAHGNEA
eukprot:8216637-Pyramimonas_sp.AAC.1